jgi:dihydroorotase
MSNILIQSGQVVDTVNLKLKRADVRIRDEKIVEVAPKLKPANGERVIDATGLLVSPGLVDIHVHLREPGDEEEETIASGASAALAGGFTDIACMPNTKPALDSETAIEFVYRQAFRAKAARVWAIGAITKGREGKELAEYAQMVRGGAVAFSDDGAGVASAGVMAKALKYLQPIGRTLIQHCEEPTLAGGAMHAGFQSTRLGLPGIPALAEELMIRRDIALVRSISGAKYHVAHISTKIGVERVRDAKAEGLAVTAEVCPHYLLLTDVAVAGYDTNYKINPPLRSPDHVEALIAGVVDGTIDCLVSDHAPHRAEEKEIEFVAAPSGIIGLECSLALFAKALVHSGKLSWPAMLAKMTDGPRDVIGRPRVAVAEGQTADLTLIDPEVEWTVDLSTFRSKSRNCPYHGGHLKGRPVMTVLEGKVKFELGAAS